MDGAIKPQRKNIITNALSIRSTLKSNGDGLPSLQETRKELERRAQARGIKSRLKQGTEYRSHKSPHGGSQQAQRSVRKYQLSKISDTLLKPSHLQQTQLQSVMPYHMSDVEMSQILQQQQLFNQHLMDMHNQQHALHDQHYAMDNQQHALHDQHHAAHNQQHALHDQHHAAHNQQHALHDQHYAMDNQQHTLHDQHHAMHHHGRGGYDTHKHVSHIHDLNEGDDQIQLARLINTDPYIAAAMQDYCTSHKTWHTKLRHRSSSGRSTMSNSTICKHQHKHHYQRTYSKSVSQSSFDTSSDESITKVNYASTNSMSDYLFSEIRSIRKLIDRYVDSKLHAHHHHGYPNYFPTPQPIFQSFQGYAPHKNPYLSPLRHRQPELNVKLSQRLSNTTSDELHHVYSQSAVNKIKNVSTKQNINQQDQLLKSSAYSEKSRFHLSSLQQQCSSVIKTPSILPLNQQRHRPSTLSETLDELRSAVSRQQSIKRSSSQNSQRYQTSSTSSLSSATPRSSRNISFSIQLSSLEMLQQNSHWNGIVKGCYFHFTKNIWKRIKKLGLVRDCKKEEIRREIANIMSSALLPTNELNNSMELIIDTLSNTDDKYIKLTDYVITTYISGKFDIQFWNLYDTIGVRPRTNNHVEGS
ncbi:unnamed protein product [Didymodactylos carnosus]|uniref:Uncharacterized protein n=1 Tax=Didymodactylos carnosus TaxID=1234261 RepID=A0A814DUN3_9BILA|nr:unnamed protein product [Didymodactylos carnosus]CAF3732327.1 unnamed protein product [Didymodactylos carnosus]